MRSIFLEDGGCFQALPAQNRHHERTRRKFEMENDQGRFRAVVMGVVHISIASVPPLDVIQTERTGKTMRECREWTGKEGENKSGRNKKKFEMRRDNTYISATSVFFPCTLRSPILLVNIFC